MGNRSDLYAGLPEDVREAVDRRADEFESEEEMEQYAREQLLRS